MSDLGKDDFNLGVAESMVSLFLPHYSQFK